MSIFSIPAKRPRGPSVIGGKPGSGELLTKAEEKGALGTLTYLDLSEALTQSGRAKDSTTALERGERCLKWRRLLFGIAFSLLAFARDARPDPRAIEFNRDIRPIFSDKCFTCHGPDAATRKTKMRLDIESMAKIELRPGHRSIAPGDPESSEIYRRISSDNKTVRMPPAYLGREKLTPREISLVRDWIAQGATWQPFWSFIPPKRPPVPAVKNSAWIRNPVDAFILSRLEREGLHPSPEADKRTLIRRVTLDLTGLPPTPAEIDSFLADSSSTAYERVVDRLLTSPRYAERMAFRWMEAARYGDSNGYQVDGPREMWRWRDWVLDAFNRNMPYDQFTVEQIAGDLLPNSTLSQRIATGFNRNHRTNGEGGIIPEEYRVEYVADRAQTTATVWMGLTLGCARCHDHKYDPFLQKDFYRLFAYFNNIPNEKGFSYNYGNEEPYLKAPLPDQERQLALLDHGSSPPKLATEACTLAFKRNKLAGNGNCAPALTIGPSPIISSSAPPTIFRFSTASIRWTPRVTRRLPISAISIPLLFPLGLTQTLPTSASFRARRTTGKALAMASI
jgi:hypothetical protein